MIFKIFFLCYYNIVGDYMKKIYYCLIFLLIFIFCINVKASTRSTMCMYENSEWGSLKLSINAGTFETILEDYQYNGNSSEYKKYLEQYKSKIIWPLNFVNFDRFNDECSDGYYCYLLEISGDQTTSNTDSAHYYTGNAQDGSYTQILSNVCPNSVKFIVSYIPFDSQDDFEIYYSGEDYKKYDKNPRFLYDIEGTKFDATNSEKYVETILFNSFDQYNENYHYFCDEDYIEYTLNKSESFTNAPTPTTDGKINCSYKNISMPEQIYFFEFTPYEYEFIISIGSTTSSAVLEDKSDFSTCPEVLRKNVENYSITDRTVCPYNDTNCYYRNDVSEIIDESIEVKPIDKEFKTNTEEYKTCVQMFGSDFLQFIDDNVFKLVYIGIPILLILLTTFDFAKVVFVEDKDGMKNATDKLKKRVILAILIYLVPKIVIFLVNYIEQDDIVSQCALYFDEQHSSVSSK